MKSFIAISTALLVCAPAIAHHGPYGNEDGKIHELNIVVGTVKPTGGTRHYSVYSRGIEKLIYQAPGGGYRDPEPYPVIYTDKIIGYGISSSEVESEFNAVNAALVTAVVPVMLPFALLSSGRTIKSYIYHVAVLNDAGRKEVRRLELYSTKDVEYLNAYLSSATDLEPGEIRAESELNEMRRSLFESAVHEVEDIALKLLVPDDKKPWCLVLKPKEGSPDFEMLRDAERKASRLAKVLGEDPVRPKTSYLDEHEYNNYLESAPHLKKWAEANPDAADKFKSCPSV